MEVVIGRAGTGKTHAMAAVRAVFEQAGHRLIGVAPSALAARGLGEGGGFEAFTFPRFQRHRAPHLDPTDIVVIDEAGMAGTVDLHRAVTTARAAGAKVILVGDHRQLPEITAGGGFAAAITAVGDQVAELTVNRRQTQDWEIAALDQLRHGDVPTAFAAYQTHGRVTVGDDPDHLHHLALCDWWAAYRTGRNALLLAGTRAEANALNRDGRTLAAANGLLTGAGLDVDGKVFQAGDRIICVRNDADGWDHDTRTRCRVDNGMIGTITASSTAIRASTSASRTGAGCGCPATTSTPAASITATPSPSTSPKASPATTCSSSAPAACTARPATSPCPAPATAPASTPPAADAATLGERPHPPASPCRPNPSTAPRATCSTPCNAPRPNSSPPACGPHLAAIADTATRHPLDHLWHRHRQCQRVVRDLERAGYRNPDRERQRLERARLHRGFLATGGRVRALDWDNVGTVQAVIDVTGTCLIRFDTPDGRTARKVLDWADVKPIDHPDPVELTDDADDYLALWDHAIGEDVAAWNAALADHGVAPDEPVIVAAAVDQRQRQCAHRLAGQQPDWLTWWYGPRPADPAGAHVWDDEIAAVAAWRDARHLDDHAAGYGPQPHIPQLQQRWREHLQRSLQVRHWLQQHQPHLTAQPRPELTAAQIQNRLAELDAILATAPADQSRILDDLRHRNRAAIDLDAAIHAALTTQGERADWILEHWPHVIEHAELTALANAHGPLDHWPVPLPADAQAIYDQLAATSVDTPEERTIGELDAAIAANDPRQQLARLQAEQRAVSDQLDRLNKERAAVAGRSDLVTVIDDHRQELVEQYRRHERDIRHARAGISLHQWGTRSDRELHAARIPASQPPRPHRTRVPGRLGHRDDSDVDGQQIAAQDGAVSELHRLVIDVAGHRERHCVTGAEPIAAGVHDEHSCRAVAAAPRRPANRPAGGADRSAGPHPLRTPRHDLRRGSAVVHLASVPHGDHDDQQYIVLDGVDDAVVAHAHP